MPPPINKPPMVKVSSSGTTGKVSPDFTSTLLSSSVEDYLEFVFFRLIDINILRGQIRTVRLPIEQPNGDPRLNSDQ